MVAWLLLAIGWMAMFAISYITEYARDMRCGRWNPPSFAVAVIWIALSPVAILVGAYESAFGHQRQYQHVHCPICGLLFCFDRRAVDAALFRECRNCGASLRVVVGNSQAAASLRARDEENARLRTQSAQYNEAVGLLLARSRESK